MADHVTDRLAARVGGETSAEESATIDAHLETCAGCRHEAEALRAAWDVLGAAEAPAAGTSVWPAVRARTTGRSVAGSGFTGRLVWRGALATAAVAAGVLLGGLVPGGGVAAADDDFAWLDAGSWSEENSETVIALWIDLDGDEEVAP